MAVGMRKQWQVSLDLELSDGEGRRGIAGNRKYQYGQPSTGRTRMIVFVVDTNSHHLVL